jgi:hypothetical protein
VRVVRLSKNETLGQLFGALTCANTPVCGAAVLALAAADGASRGLIFPTAAPRRAFATGSAPRAGVSCAARWLH